MTLTFLRPIVLLCAVWMTSFASCLAAETAAPVQHLVPSYQYEQTLVAAADMDGGSYLAFPVTVRLSDTEILIGYKRGFTHAFDREATFDLVRLNSATERFQRQSPALRRENLNLQNGEFVRFANGDIACYIDVQKPGREPESSEATRLGLIEFRSSDGGRSFHDMGKVGLIDGVEYGYVFDAITENQTTWMLAMTFANLPGAKMISSARPKAGAVVVLRTDNNGKSWQRVKDLSATFQGSLNESAFVRHEDGFLFVCRPYADAQPVIITDADFNPRRTIDLVKEYGFVAKGMGRPRVFARDGKYYILARNTFKAGFRLGSTAQAEATLERPRLSLLRIDSKTLAVEKHVLLDNAENQRVISAYYATPYWQSRKGRTYFNVITYKQMSGRMPEIVRFEYEWDEVK
jgi:hypothetical protein